MVRVLAVVAVLLGMVGVACATWTQCDPPNSGTATPIDAAGNQVPNASPVPFYFPPVFAQPTLKWRGKYLRSGLTTSGACWTSQVDPGEEQDYPVYVLRFYRNELGDMRVVEKSINGDGTVTTQTYAVGP